MSNTVQSLQGSAQLVLDVVSGVTNIVERMHRTIADRANPLAGWLRQSNPERGVEAASAYTALQAVTQKLQHGIKIGANGVNAANGHRYAIPSSTKTIAALNGVCGDHLEASENPFAIDMHFHTGERILAPDKDSISSAICAPSADIVVMVHGWCLSYEYWQRDGSKSIADSLQQAIGVTPIYLNYNTGRHISTNGLEMATRLEQLVAAWPMEVKSLTLIGHSMGGLVVRSACWHAERDGHRWLGPLKNAVYLGSPHHGAAVAKAGHLLTYTIMLSRYSAPLAFGQYSSAGVKDLLHGNLLDEDWQDVDQAGLVADTRRPVPLTPHAEHFFMAAAVGKGRNDVTSLVLGDLLVRLGSATGDHRDDLRRLDVKAGNCRILEGQNHFDLLDCDSVQDQIIDWLS